MLLLRSPTTTRAQLTFVNVIGTGDYNRRAILNHLIRGIESGCQELPCSFPGTAALEYGATCDQDLCASAHNVCNRIVMYAAVHFNTKLQTARLPNFRKRLDFFKGRLDEGLTAKPGIDAHDKHVMNKRKNFVKGVDRSGGVYHYSWLTTVGSDELERAIEVDTGFLMHRDPVDASLHESGDELVRPLNHEMAIERDLGDLAK